MFSFLRRKESKNTVGEEHRRLVATTSTAVKEEEVEDESSMTMTTNHPKTHIQRRTPSLDTSIERFVLHAILVDTNNNDDNHHALTTVDEDLILLRVVPGIIPSPSSITTTNNNNSEGNDGDIPTTTPRHERNESNASTEISNLSTGGGTAVRTLRTDGTVLPLSSRDDDDDNDESQEDDDDDDKQFTTTLTKRPFFNTWNVLRDEYAPDFGFDYKEDEHTRSAVFSNENWDSQPRVFSILGTHVDDTSAQPHVLSPPLMESLLMFVPEALSMENFWLKYSMVRDGASLQTLRHYCRAAPDTILAIETTEGHVLGAFTSHVWKESSTFYGSAPAFLWRMRENRRTPPCHSLFEQAQLESIIDVYNLVLDEDDPNNNGIQLVQLCQPNGFLAIGGGEYQIPHRERIGVKDWVQTGDNYGFGIALLDEDMRRGTTSPCKTFRNKCLVNNMSDGEVFQVANLEVWTFTPCVDVTSAEQMEWRNYYLRQQRQQQKQKQHEGYQDFYRRMGQEED
eukprot:scaffold9758_cov167-Amphora_coffeaeformis.AAC.3